VFWIVEQSADLLKLAPAISRLRQTNFRIDPALLDKMLAVDALRIPKLHE
jgi:hypothetical protein